MSNTQKREDKGVRLLCRFISEWHQHSLNNWIEAIREHGLPMTEKRRLEKRKGLMREREDKFKRIDQERQAAQGTDREKELELQCRVAFQEIMLAFYGEGDYDEPAMFLYTPEHYCSEFRDWYISVWRSRKLMIARWIAWGMGLIFRWKAFIVVWAISLGWVICNEEGIAKYLLW